MGQDGVSQIDAEVGEVGAWALRDGEIGLPRKNGNHVGGECADFEIGGAFAEFESADDGVRNDAKADAIELRRASKVSGISFDDDFVVLGLADEFVGTRADGMLREISSGVSGHDADGRANEVDGEGGVGFFEMEDDGGGVGSVDGSDEAEGAAFGRVVGRVADEVESGFNVGRSDGAAIGETDGLAKMEDVGERVGNFPGFGEVAVEIHLGVAFEERGEEKAVNVGGVGVGSKAGIEIGGIGFDEEGDG